MLRIFRNLLKRIGKYVVLKALKKEDIDDLIGEVIISLLAAYKKYKNVKPALEENIIKKTALRFIGRLKSESVLKEKLRKEVMKFLGLENSNIGENKEEENGS
ncbi:MAG: hypothetical protein ACK4NF_05345 [Planctomycetota bacterium]